MRLSQWCEGMEKYSIVRMAGRGAYGTVYLARRNTDGKEVISNTLYVYI